MEAKIRGIVDLPLHGGKCPSWLFTKMKKLAGSIAEIIIDEYGQEEFLKRISDPYWFQAFGCVLGFDWHSSGLTTTTLAALKESLDKKNLGICVVGGKGKHSRDVQERIMEKSDEMNLKETQKEKLKRISRLTAKIDNSLIQDGFNLYQHSIIFSRRGWAVVQQGMKEDYARRYHWINTEDMLNDPHSGIISDRVTKPLNLASKVSNETRDKSLELIQENPIKLKRYLTEVKIKQKQKTLFDFVDRDEKVSFKMAKQHFPKIDADLKTLMKAYEAQPKNYEELILIRGMGQKNIRALALISHLIYGTRISWKDPVKYSFAHGGKDGWPYPVNREVFANSINFLKDAVKHTSLSNEKIKALRRLNKFYSNFKEIKKYNN